MTKKRRSAESILTLIRNELDHEEVVSEGLYGSDYKAPSDEELKEKTLPLLKDEALRGLLTHLSAPQVGVLMKPLVEGHEQKIEIGRGLLHNYESEGFHDAKGAKKFLDRLHKQAKKKGAKLEIRVDAKQREIGDVAAPEKYSVIKYKFIMSQSLDEYATPPKKKQKIVKKKKRPVKREK